MFDSTGPCGRTQGSAELFAFNTKAKPPAEDPTRQLANFLVAAPLPLLDLGRTYIIARRVGR
jgi:hypothetical protein